MNQIAQFWGFPRALGAVYGALYLAPRPLSLDELVELTGVTKGAVSTHARSLERLQMVHKRVELGDRKDYYVAETKLWKVVKNVLAQRRQQDFDRALAAVGDLVEATRGLTVRRDHADRHALYLARLEAMQSFFTSLDAIVGAVLTLDELRLQTAKRAVAAVLQRPQRGRKK
jgi:DNA-binding transcriptional regulator GbsR (MarR family)